MVYKCNYTSIVCKLSILAIIFNERIDIDMKKNYEQEVEIIFKEHQDFEKQLQIINEVNNHFIDIATTYHVNKINDKDKN